MHRTRPLESASPELSPPDYLRALGEKTEGPYDLATAALMLSALDQPDRKLETYRTHLSELAEAVRQEAVFARDGEAGAQALASMIAGRFGYEGEREQYDDPRNADLMSVIERRRGLPVALGILYIHAARASGMQAEGLLSPGHFLLCVAVKGSEVVIDPFNNGAVLEREHLSTPGMGTPLIAMEANAPGQPDPFEAIGDIDVLLRLLNNIKNRAMRTRDNARAAEILRRMVLIAPRRNYVWLELAHVQEGLGALSGARMAYETCLKLSHSGDDISNEAAFALHALKRRLN